MRKVLINFLRELAAQDKRIMLLTGDLGFALVEPFANEFPDRFINVGVAEQNMIGVATGLADAGFIPYAYSITPFAVLRPYEFIRNGPIYHHLKVRIVGAGSGFEYSHDGITHFGIDDIGVLRVQPGISIFAPADYQQADTIYHQTWDIPGPVYYRISKDEKTVIPGLDGKFTPGRAEVIGDGTDLLLISMGSITSEVVAAMSGLSEKGISSTLMIVSSINPPPVQTLHQVLPKFKQILTIEAHYINGGLGSLICEFVAENGYHCTVTRCGVKTMPDGKTGNYPNMLNRFGISREAILETSLNIFPKA